MWGVILGILAVWAILRLINPSRKASVPKTELETQATAYPRSAYYRAWRSVAAVKQRYLLPESFTSVFGRVTRIQILILVIILGYLLVFSLVAIVYKTYITPVKGTNLFNTRTGMAGFSDRIGILAYALTPLSVLLSSRESMLSLITGISYQHFNFLHRWVGRIIFVQSFLHTLAWTIVEGKLYQPQPSVFQTFIAEPYIIWGCFAMLFITFLYVFSLRRVIQWTGYEFFKKSHYVVASLYIGACWGHWDKLYFWMLASLIVILLDLGLRILGIGLNHIGYTKSGCFTPAPATLRTFGTGSDTAIRIDFSHPSPAWKPGQHYYLCFPALSIWQSHPFTPSALPPISGATPRHTYIIRALSGETSRLATLSREIEGATTPVILTGPYGARITTDTPNLLAVAGGTGISFALPLVMEAAGSENHKRGLVQLVWVVRRARDLAWVQEEMGVLRARAAEGQGRFEVKIFVTREGGPMEGEVEEDEVVVIEAKDSEKLETVADVEDKTSEKTDSSLDLSALVGESRGFSVTYLGGAHPDLGTVLEDYIERSPTSGGRIQVMASGPAGIGSTLRSAVANCNDGKKVRKGDERSDVGLYWDDRFL
ncbi:hypothetical protein V494_06508 [Pseudogymnoascus sp. VKM F-4513 (FW-928)]|nr:hypothetical protein V494_06508 [Pseudogymnoascus sp. VKM F-4513 (FW-928)]